MSIIVFAFHYNRGKFLENLVASVERHIPGVPLVIFDDGSTEPESINALEELATRHEVFYPDGDKDLDPSTGGLNANMNKAMKIARERGYKYTLMIQDDMQIVRDVDATDLDIIERNFARQDASFVLGPSFQATKRGKRIASKLVPTNVEGVCELSPRFQENNVHGHHFAYLDCGIFHVEKFFEQLGYLEAGEKKNETKLRALGFKMGVLVQPFMFFLPLPVSFSSGKRNWRVRFYDRLAGAGVYPIAPITRADFEGHEAVAPHAEDILVAPSLPKVKYWSLRGGGSNLKSRGGWRKIIAKLLFA